MKSMLTKIPAIIAMTIAILVVIGFCVMLWLISLENTFMHQGIGLAWMTFSLIFIALTLVLYTCDAILSIIKSCMKIAPVFNAILSLIILSEISLTIIIFNVHYTLGSAGLLLWLLLYITIFVLQIVSVIKHIKIKSAQGDNN